MAINVKDAAYGAAGNGTTDDTSAIQNAINFAKSLTAPGGGTYRATVYFPAGYYRITAPINVSNTNGIWLLGDGGRYLNTNIIGLNSGAIFDFSGSTASGCEDFTFISPASYGNNRSSIGVLFALTTNGGSNSGIRNCTFQMEDLPTANGGLGTIGILNVRSEEFQVSDCLIRANTPVIFSNQANLSELGPTFTVTSSFQTLSSGTGSMGVVTITGTSLQTYQKRQPAMLLNGTNSLSFSGYIGRLSNDSGSNETAILCNRYTTNMLINATIESFSRILKVTLAGFDNNELNIVLANSTSPNTELVDVTNCSVRGLKLKVSLPNLSERNRNIMYHAPAGEGYQQAGGFLISSDITCFDVTNQSIITQNLLKKSTNVTFNTDQPFEKKGGRIKQSFTNDVSAGLAGAIVPAEIVRFRQANQLPFNGNNNFGGYYRIWIEGVVQAGVYTTNGASTLSFQAQILVNQRYNGVFDLPSATVIILDRIETSPSYLTITGVLIDVNFSNGVGIVLLTPKVMGSGSGEGVSYSGHAEIQSNFLTNDPILYK